MPHLPQELYCHICWQLGPSDSDGSAEKRAKRAALASLMAVNKAFYSAALPPFYHTLDLAIPRAPTINSILRVMVEHPDLAELVQVIKLAKGTAWSPDFRGFDSPKLIPHLLAAFERVNISPALRAEMQAKVRSEEAGFALLLGLCTKLRSLELSIHATTHQNDLIKKLALDAAVCSSREVEIMPNMIRGRKPLQYLRELRIQHYMDGNEDITSMSSFLQLPSLRTFGGHFLGCTETPFGFRSSLESNVRRITLAYSLVDSIGLDRLLTNCPQLTELNLVVGDEENDMALHLEFEKIGDVLRRRGTQLQVLNMTLDAPLLRRETPSLLGSLNGMDALTELGLPYGALFGTKSSHDTASLDFFTHTLPTSLRTLRISDAAEWANAVTNLDTRLSSLMAHESFRDLQRIWIHREGERTFRGDVPPGWYLPVRDLTSWVKLERR